MPQLALFTDEDFREDCREAFGVKPKLPSTVRPKNFARCSECRSIVPEEELEGGLCPECNDRPSNKKEVNS